MNYFKIIAGNTFIGAVTSYNFFIEVNKKLRSSNDILGQFVEYEGHLYRDYWMAPIPNNSRVFIEARISQITQEEYTAFVKAQQSDEPIIIDDDEPTPEPTPPPTPSEEPDAMLEYIRESKIHEMSQACKQVIELGMDIEIRGENRHFSLSTQDQLNLISLSTMAQTQDLIPYHADGETYIFYTADEIKQIVAATTTHKTYHTTYYNALKNYINSLETIEEIAAITYGTPIPDEYKSEVLKVIEQ